MGGTTSYRIIGAMARTDLYLKVEIDHDSSEQPDRLAAELCRMLQKQHGVRVATLQHYIVQQPGD